jgi:hypothetical protein
MKRRHLVISALTALVLSALVLAQSAADAFQDDLISNLEGTWRLGRQIRGTKVENQARASWILNHQFLQLHMKDVADPPKYEAIVLIGYVSSEKQYVAYWTDTYGAKVSAAGRGTRTGNSVEFRFEYPDGPFFNTFTWFPERREWEFRMESQGPSGARKLFAVDTLVATR